MKRFLVISRYLLIIPVIGSVLLTAAVVIMAMGRIFTAGLKPFLEGDFSVKASKQLSIGVIEIIDLFLVGTVAYITAIGLYKLFISKTEIDLPMRLKINSLKDLEDKIEFVDYYNNHRYHESLKNLKPNDVYLGRDQKILQENQNIKRKTMQSRRMYYLKKLTYNQQTVS